jgi:hypothetical protein
VRTGYVSRREQLEGEPREEQRLNSSAVPNSRCWGGHHTTTTLAEQDVLLQDSRVDPNGTVQLGILMRSIPSSGSCWDAHPGYGR